MPSILREVLFNDVKGALNVLSLFLLAFYKLWLTLVLDLTNAFLPNTPGEISDSKDKKTDCTT